MTVKLGDVEFDPVESSDFSLSVEGTRGTGKSNTLAVMLEDLAETTYPTLIIERIGALLPVRVADESIIVVGGKDTEQVDLVVPLDDLSNVGDWVLDHGLKVLVDISTYADYESEESMVHAAAANAVSSLMSSAEQKYKSPQETRTKCLLLIDEGDYLAPKSNAPTPAQKGKHVQRARGHIVRASTEGGNFGVSPVVAYQRRAYIANGVLNLCTNWIVHGLESDDLSRAAKSLRVDDDILDGLRTGEIVAKGDVITGGEVVGPTKVRKRDTPDPREDTFEVPDTPPEVERVIETIQDDLGDPDAPDDADDETGGGERETWVNEDVNWSEAAAASQLKEENDRLKDELEEAREEADDVLQAEAEELRNALKEERQTLSSLKDDLDSVREERDSALERADELEARVADLEALETSVDTAAEYLYDALDALGRGDPDAGDMSAELADLREQVSELQAENERLRQQSPREVVPEDADYIDFIEQEPVKDAIDEAKEESAASPNYVRGVIAAIVEEGGSVSYDDIADRLGVATTSDISTAATTLDKKRVVTKDTGKTPYEVDLNMGGIEDIMAAREKQQRTQSVMEKI